MLDMALTHGDRSGIARGHQKRGRERYRGHSHSTCAEARPDDGSLEAGRVGSVGCRLANVWLAELKSPISL